MSVQSMKLIFGINGPFRIRLDKSWFSVRTVLVDSRVPHCVDGEGDWQLVLWINMDTSVGKTMQDKVLKGRPWSSHKVNPPPAVGEVVQTAGDVPSPRGALRLAEVLLRVYAGCRAIPATWDERMKNLVRSIEENPGLVTSGSLVSDSGLSKLELDADFRRVLGSGIDSYLRRRKMMQFVELFNQGVEPEAALHSSGLPGRQGLADYFLDEYGLDLEVLIESKPFVRVYSGSDDQASLYI